jgi:hypothetical protein
MADNLKARELLPDGSYRRVVPDAAQARTRSQERFLEIAAQNATRRLTEAQPPPIPFLDANAPSSRRPRKRQTS